MRNSSPNLQSESRPGEALSATQASAMALFWRGFVISILSILGIGAVGTAIALAGYVYIALKLPSPDELQSRAASFKSTRIYDRNGKLLYEINDPMGGRRTVVSLDQIPETLRDATIATEDPTFYSNPGFNVLSIGRAFFDLATQGHIVSGASTITQQLVKLLFVGNDITMQRKIKEVVLASEITRTYSKDKILETYLNEIYYGNMAYGVDAAAETYFNKPVSQLTLAESALLVGIVPAPALRDPFTNPDEAEAARNVVLDRMVTHGYITAQEAEAAKAEPLGVVSSPPTTAIQAPHFVFYVRQLLEDKYGAQTIYRDGLQVQTTLDLDMQQQAEQAVKTQIANLASQHATNGALVAIDPQTGEILSMVGSVDFNNASIGGQVNVTLRPRQPGSSIKPLTYAAAFEKGWNPATMIMDTKLVLPDPVQGTWEPTNYDLKEHGPVSVRTALACSYNVPAVKTLQFIGIPALLEMARRLGITSLNRTDYGLSLTLGAGEVSPLEMAGAYSAFATGGIYRAPQAILSIKDSDGHVLYQYDPGAGRQVLDPRIAYQITDILSDNNARTPMFGAHSQLVLPGYQAAVKTGTTNDNRDAWTIGYTTSLVTAVWVGNNDNSKMLQTAGASGAAPIWHNFMLAGMKIQEKNEGEKAAPFTQPPGMVEVEVCSVSGELPTADCPSRRKELFIQGKQPTQTCSVHRRIAICTVSGKLAGPYCPPNTVVQKLFEVYPPDGQAWAVAHGIEQPPTDTCDVHTGQTNVSFSQPQEGQQIQGVVAINGSVQINDMSHYRLEYGVGNNPQGWALIEEHDSGGMVNAHLGNWDTNHVANGDYTLRIIAIDSHNNQFEARVHVHVQNDNPSLWPTPSPLPTETASPTMEASPTPLPTDTAEPTRTPRHQPTPTAELPTETAPAPTETATPVHATPTTEVQQVTAT